MKIGYITTTDPRDKRSWSGTHYYMAEALRRAGHDVVLLGPLQPAFTLTIMRIKSRIVSMFSGKRFAYRHSKTLSRAYARMLHKRITPDMDLLIAPAASSPLGMLKTKIPIVYISDSTFALSRNYHIALSGLTNEAVQAGMYLELEAISKAAMVSYPSEWAARSAVHDFGAEREKVKVIPFGANIDEAPQKIPKTGEGKLNLLLVGVSWEHKGGNTAVETLRLLKRKFPDVTLTVCGCTPPRTTRIDGLKIVPFLNKEIPEEKEKLEELYRNASFLILPTRFEAYGIVFCEASAYGVPSIAPETGGTAGAIKDEVNGILVSKDAKAEEYAEAITNIWEDKKRYRELSESSRKLFEDKLNWDAWARTIIKEYQSLNNVRQEVRKAV